VVSSKPSGTLHPAEIDLCVEYREVSRFLPSYVTSNLLGYCGAVEIRGEPEVSKECIISAIA
jgi:hypothetical protein